MGDAWPASSEGLVTITRTRFYGRRGPLYVWSRCNKVAPVTRPSDARSKVTRTDASELAPNMVPPR